MRPARLGAAVALAAACSSPWACPLQPADGQRLQAGDAEAAWRVAGGGRIAVGQPFAIEVRVCPADWQLARVDATMPAHRHGMNYRPSIRAQGDGRYRVDGLLWHMGGRWQLALGLQRHGGRIETLSADVELP